jgi:mannose-6-phosphate isomerase-like protein (cupin superfamily)
MEITRFDEARPYIAPKHFDMRSLRLQGFDASASKFAWLGLSHFLPGGGAEMDASPLEKLYVVLSGEITVELGDGARAVRNNGNAVATMLVAMPHPGPRP